MHVNLAVAYKGLERLPEAWYHLDAYLMKTTKERDPAVEKERDGVEKALVKTHIPLRFSCDAPGTTLSIDGSVDNRYPCPLRWWFKRGTEGTVTASAPGHVQGETPIRAHELDRDRRIVVTLKPAKKPNVPIKEDQGTGGVSKPAERPSRRARHWSRFGGGMALVATGAILQVVASNKDQQLRKDYPGDVTDWTEWQANRKGYQDGFNKDVKPLAYSAYAMYGIGGAAAVTGLVFLIAYWSKPAAPATARVRPLMAPDVLGVTLDLDF